MNYKGNWEKTKQENSTLDPKTDLRIWMGIRRRIEQEEKTKTKSWYWAAASIIFFLTVGMIVVHFGAGNLHSTETTRAQEIVYKSGDATIRVVLKDGSTIILEPKSQLTVSANFGVERRSVNFSGQGYFEVAKNVEKVFEVNGEDFQVSVLGTKFKLSSTKEQKYVELLEGKVKVDTPKDQTILNPQESWTWKDQRSFHYYSAANSKSFTFKDTPYKQVISEIESIYNIQINIPLNYHNETLTGSLTGNLSELLTQVSFPFNLSVNKKSESKYELK